MTPSRRQWIPWTLVLLLLAGVPSRQLHSSFSAERAPDGERFDHLEAENAELRQQLSELAEQIKQLHEAQALGQTQLPSHVGVLERWPIPEQLSFADEVVPLDDPTVYARVEEEWTRYLVNRHWLLSWLRRSREVFPVVEAKLAAAGLPDDLKYVVVVESGLRARAYSSAGAVGYWQFIRSTGERYGLERNTWRDDRRNLESSTDAAIAYLSEMHDEFGSWPLVLAGFNAGEARVRDSIEQQGTSNYYQMVLPSETESYWFRAVVLKELLGHAQRYDLHLPQDGWVASVTDKVSLRVSQDRLDLKEITAATGMSYRELKELNPQLRRSWLPKGTHEVTLPRSKVDAFVSAFPRSTVVASRGSVGSAPGAESLSAGESPTSPRP